MDVKKYRFIIAIFNKVVYYFIYKIIKFIFSPLLSSSLHSFYEENFTTTRIRSFKNGYTILYVILINLLIFLDNIKIEYKLLIYLSIQDE
jgi:hypothetical protein